MGKPDREVVRHVIKGKMDTVVVEANTLLLFAISHVSSHFVPRQGESAGTDIPFTTW
jgi:hypothetical protein